MSPDLWGILKRKVEERKVSNIHQLRDVIMEEWKRTPVATCEAQFGHFHFRGVLPFVASSLDINGCVLSYFEVRANLHCYTSCTFTTLHCIKV